MPHDPSFLPPSLSGARCLVFGLGVSGAAVLRRLLTEGADVSVSERDEAKLASLPSGVRAVSPDEGRYDFVFRSPGVRPDAPAISLHRARGARVSGETELFLSRCPCPVFGVTGSDGKTTTATLAHAMLSEEGAARGFRAHLGGNVGHSLLDDLGAITPGDFAVLELSSFQLADFAPRLAAAAVTNVTPNHLNWHRDFAEYRDAKLHILSAARRTVLNGGDEVLSSLVPQNGAVFSARMPEEALARRYPGRTLLFCRDGVLCATENGETTALFHRAECPLPGAYNTENLLAAAGLCLGAASPGAIRRAAARFRGVRHRLEKVAMWNGVCFYDSSIDTSPSRTRATLSALSRPPVVVAGGKTKGLPLLPLAEALASLSTGAVLTGETAEEIARDLSRIAPAFPVRVVPDMAHAVCAAAELARMAGTDVLLSPGCTSFDAYPNFEARGDDFARCARERTDTGNAPAPGGTE